MTLHLYAFVIGFANNDVIRWVRENQIVWFVRICGSLFFSGTLTFFLREFDGKFLTFERQKLKIEPHVMQKPCSLRHPQLIGFGWIIAMKFGEISSSDQFDIVFAQKKRVTRIEWNSLDLDGFRWSRLLTSINSSKKSYINLPTSRWLYLSMACWMDGSLHWSRKQSSRKHGCPHPQLGHQKLEVFRTMPPQVPKL